MTINRIVITGDFDRPLAQHGNILFFYGLLKTQLAMLSGLSVEAVAYPLKTYLDTDTWLERESSLEWSHVDGFTSDDFVIGFEMSEALIHSLGEREIPFIAFDIDPLRFLNDLCLRLTHVSRHFEIPARFSVSDFELMASASYVAGAKARIPGIGCPKGSVLVIGQTQYDRSVIYERRFHSVQDHIDVIKKLADNRSIFYKAHPYKDDAIEVCSMLAARDASAINIYRLLSQPEFEIVIGLSSSVLYECPWFGKTAQNLLPLKKSLLTVPGRDFVTTAFWHSFLWQIMNPFCSANSFTAPYCPGMLRRGLSVFWGYDL